MAHHSTFKSLISLFAYDKKILYSTFCLYYDLLKVIKTLFREDKITLNIYIKNLFLQNMLSGFSKCYVPVYAGSDKITQTDFNLVVV